MEYQVEELPLLIMGGSVKIEHLSNNLLERLLEYCEEKYENTNAEMYHTVAEMIKKYIR